jgi:hypothetical protein
MNVAPTASSRMNRRIGRGLRDRRNRRRGLCLPSGNPAQRDSRGDRGGNDEFAHKPFLCLPVRVDRIALFRGLC